MCNFRKLWLLFAGDPLRQVPQLFLDLTDTKHQLLGVALSFTPSRERVILDLPAWTPGSYLIRDYVSRLEGLAAEQEGRPCPMQRIGVARWQLQVQPASELRLTYRILARECTVRTAHLSGDHGFLPLAAVVLEVEGERWAPWRLQLSLPPGWSPFLALPADPSGGWIAASFDQLIDTPIEAGPFPEHRFSVAGVPHRWVCWGEDLASSDPRWLADVAAVCEACCRLMGEPVPAASNYLFILHLLDQGYGGLEHDNSSVLQFGRHSLAGAAGRRQLLQLLAHEYLHQWNVRRLRPAELAPVAYGQPSVLPTLWFAEGVTSYFDQLLPLMAGVSDEAGVLEELEKDLSRYLSTPGRRVQSLRQSSEEAWVKLYRQDAAAPDQQISYYLKGAVLALVLDLHLRRQGSSLAAVLQQLWRRFGRQGRGYQERDLIAAFAEPAPDLAELLPIWLESHEDPPLSSYLADVGLVLQPEAASHPYTGLVLESSPAMAMVVRRVARQSPAAAAELLAGDELLALDGERLRSAESLQALCRQGEPQQLLFCRDGRIRQSLLTPAAPERQRWRLHSVAEAPASVLERRRRWLEVVA
ncbi:MAG: PDZ domain-containing protein [Prochlorococcaceae cyanobacterium]